MKVKTFNFQAESKTSEMVVTESKSEKSLMDPDLYREDQIVSEFMSKVDVKDVKISFYTTSTQQTESTINKRIDSVGGQTVVPARVTSVRNMKSISIFYEDKK